MTFEAVTTYARHHWQGHAKRCVDSFAKHWDGVRLRAFFDEELEERSTWLRAFKRRHAHRPTDNYRFDAVRFAHKVAAIELAYAECGADALIWMDADCVTHAPVDAAWLTGLLADGEFAYLKRANKYPECGFMIFRRCDNVAAFLRSVVKLYTTDELFNLYEWHDSFAIEKMRIAHEAGGLRCVSLSGGAESTGHPLVNGPLGERLDHLKGKRKQVGRSHDTDLARPRTETYWRKTA